MTYKDISTHRIGTIVRKMKLTNGSIVLLKHGVFTNENVEEFAKAIRDTSLKDVVLVVVDDLDNVRALPEIEMNTNGWYRIETLRNIIFKNKKLETVQDENHNEQ